jgi:two-component system OmpR family sensor kinase
VTASVELIRNPSSEIYAVEVVVLSFALLYGFGVWPVVPTIISVAAFVTFTWTVMVPRVADGTLPAPELVEVAVPAVLATVVIYHARRRDQAIRRARFLAELDRRRAAARERLGRMTSHELRTPLTVAGGYVEQLLATETDPVRREDLLVVEGELRHLARITDRLVRAVALDLGAPDEVTDVKHLLDDVKRRWEVVTERDLVVDCGVDTVAVNAGRLRAALDTLVENAVRYTGEGDRIRLFAERIGDELAVGVSDAGPGLSPERLAHINEAADDAVDAEDVDDADGSASERLRDTYSQTGFGLRMVASVAMTAGGRLEAGTAREGGARLAIVLGGAGSAGHRTSSVRGVDRDNDPEVPVRSRK